MRTSFLKLMLPSALSAVLIVNVSLSSAQDFNDVPNDLKYTLSVFDSRIYSSLFGTDEMRAVYNDERLIEYWLSVEVALAKAQAKYGMIPLEAAQEIEKVAKFSNIDLAKLKQATGKVGRPVDGLVRQLRALNPTVKAYVHLGSTTQEVMDTATVLQMLDGINIVEAQLKKLILKLADISEQYKSLPMVSRTNGQDALPTTFGMMTASYMSELSRNLTRLRAAKEAVAVGQIGSAVGTLSSMGPDGLKIQEEALKILGLKVPDISWNASRDNYAAVVQALGLINGTMGRIAQDINLWSRTADNAVNEGEGGASSTMPQKRNPRASEFLGGLAAMSRIREAGALEMLQQSETRQGAPWISEWSTIPEMFMITSTSLERANRLFNKIIIKPQVMSERFNDSKYFVMAEAVQQEISKKVGLGKSHSMVVDAIKKAPKNSDFYELLSKDPEISKILPEADIKRVLNPKNYLGHASALVERAVSIARGNCAK